MFDAVMFLAGAVLFLFAVLFFLYVWWERGKVTRQRATVAESETALKEQKVELEIWHNELEVWHNNLEREQLQLEQEREELRILAASQARAQARSRTGRVLSAPKDNVQPSQEEAASRPPVNANGGVPDSASPASVSNTSNDIKQDAWGKNLKNIGHSSGA